MSKTLSLFHIVFGTKNRTSAIIPNHADDINRIIWNECKKLNCYLYRVFTMPDHIHILVNLHPNIALADFVNKIKSNSSQFASKSPYFPLFTGWCKGYFAESKSLENLDIIIEYIKKQDIHHTTRSYVDEMKWFYKRNALQWHDDDLM